MAGASKVDTQLSDMVSGSESCGAHALKRAREYAGTAHFIGLLAGVVGTGDEIAEARATVTSVLSQIGFDPSEAAMRKESLAKAAEWKKLSDMPTAGMTPEQKTAHLAKMDEAMKAWGDAAKPLADKYSPQGVWDRLWNSVAKIYNDAIKFVREDMWKLSACKMSVDAGFIILETGVAVALAAMGMAAAAAFLRVVAIASHTSRIVRISVVAERGLAKGAAARNPGAHFAERQYKGEIDTGAINKDAKALLDESGQGNATKADRDGRNGDEGGFGSTKKWKEKQVLGRKVYQRNDLFDPNFVDDAGMSNLQRMKNGFAPIGKDGNEINLHHVTQTEPGPMAELLKTTHGENHRLLHTYANQYDKTWRAPDGSRKRYQSAPETMNRGPFDKWKEQYWIGRAKDFQQ